jgi:hypothetical protein
MIKTFNNSEKPPARKDALPAACSLNYSKTGCCPVSIDKSS